MEVDFFFFLELSEIPHRNLPGSGSKFVGNEGRGASSSIHPSQMTCLGA